jgi:hypothetical protein
MARLVFAIPCLSVLRDADYDIPSYVHVVEGIAAESTPAEIHPFRIATYWFNPDPEPSSLHLRLRVVSPSGDEVAERDLDPSRLTPLEQYGRYRINIGTPKVEAKEFGVYDFVIEKESEGEWEEVASLPVSLDQAEDETGEAGE